jgi:integrase
MSVVLRKWTNKEGRVVERWAIDVKAKLAGSSRVIRVRDFSPVDTKRGAEQYERQVRQRILDGTFGKEERAEAPTLEQFQERFLVYSHTNNKPSTARTKRLALANHLIPFFGRMRLDQIGPEQIERYKAQKLRAGQDPKSINNHLCYLRKALNLAEEWEVIERAPKVRNLRVPPQEFRFLDLDEAERFVQTAAPEWRAMLITALKTGLRLGELLALKWEDVDLKAGRFIVRRSLWQSIEGTPKGGRSREVPLSPGALAVLKEHRHLRGDYVFCHPDGRRLSHSEVKDVVPRTCKRAGLPKRLTWHDLRHTFASHLVMRGRSLSEIQELLGHTTIAMTQRYAHLSPQVKRDAVEVLDLPAGTQEGHKVLRNTAAGVLSSGTPAT